MTLSFADYIIPVLLLVILAIAACKRLPVFDVFRKGAGGGFGLCLDILPTIAAILIAVGLLRACGLTVQLAELLEPMFSWLGIPQELAELVLLRPFSGSGSIALYKDLIAIYGADAYLTRCAAVIMASSETIFYVTGVYLASTKVKRLRYGIPIALVASVVGTILSCLFCKLM